MAQPLDERTTLALGHFEGFATTGTQLVLRGREAYYKDPMLKLAGEAIMRRFEDAVSRLDEAFLAAHPSIDWPAMSMTRELANGPAGDYEEYWEFLETRLPVEVRKVRRILDDWASRPPAHPVGWVADQTLEAAGPRPGGRGQEAGLIEDEEFSQLVERLNDWAESAWAPSDDGPIDLVLPGGRTVRIVMTANDLQGIFVVVGTFDGALFSVMEAVRNLPDDAPYLIYGPNHFLEPSAEPALPPRHRRRGQA